METLKDKIAFYSLLIAFVATFAGYGVWVGKISTRVDNLEERTTKIESTIDTKIDSMATSINELTVQTAVLSEKVDQLRAEVKNGRE